MIAITSSTPSGSSCTTEETIARAEDAPIAPASWISANRTSRASASSSSAAATPRDRA